jgi:hypothetical protein
MRAFLLITSTALGLVGSAWAAAVVGPFAAGKTSACLNGRKVLTSAFDVKRVGPPAFKPRPVAAVTFGFPFASGKQALDSGMIVFDRDPPTARRHYTALLAWNFASAAQVKGISQTKARAQIRRRLSTTGNVVISWNTDAQPASRTTVSNCLR